MQIADTQITRLTTIEGKGREKVNSKRIYILTFK